MDSMHCIKMIVGGAQTMGKICQGVDRVSVSCTNSVQEVVMQIPSLPTVEHFSKQVYSHLNYNHSSFIKTF